MALLLVVRHGETAWNREARLQGHVDVPLSDVGRDQAAAVGAELAAELGGAPPPPLVFASDLTRARDTADAIARALRAGAVLVRADLRERGYGAGEGKTFDELGRVHPDAVLAYRAGDRDAIPGSEPWGSFRARALAAARAVAVEVERAARSAAPPRPPVGVVVAHGGVVKALLEEALGADKRFLIANGAVYRFRLGAAGPIERVVAPGR